MTTGRINQVTYWAHHCRLELGIATGCGRSGEMQFKQAEYRDRQDRAYIAAAPSRLPLRTLTIMPSLPFSHPAQLLVALPSYHSSKTCTTRTD